jgi:endonuclease/exonuclease/phosphatase family metal-dependent hydrolase
MVTRKSATPPPARNVVVAENDTYSFAVDDLVPQQYRGTDRYLDVIQWNLEWFGASKSTEWDKSRWSLVVGILEKLNADLFVFQEVAGPTETRTGVIDAVAAELTARGAGEYVVDYTRAGGEQRVAMMWDRQWLRAKSEVSELFKRGAHKLDDGSDAFAGRTPLYGWFTGKLPTGPSSRAGGSFDFQMLGVHLKAMADGAAQREESARVLAKWMRKEAPMVDADVLIMGDFNAPPGDACWAPFHKLEDEGRAGFRKINDPSDFSYLWLDNKKDRYLSRIDLTVASTSSQTRVAGTLARTVRWKPIEEVIAATQGKLTDRQVTALLKQIKESISDHLPVFSRFYFTQPARPARPR